jgi:large subunit ribosomal protein L6
MKNQIKESVEIPEGISCNIEGYNLTCSKDGKQTVKSFDLPTTEISTENNQITFTCPSGNKTHYKKIKTFVAHINNIFNGLQNPFIYKLEIGHVHFPMTVKVEGDKVTITNFLGETTLRTAKIHPNTTVDIKGTEISVTSHDKEAAGQTAANIEKAVRINNRDRRIFQDGIHITEKPTRSIEESTEEESKDAE